MGKPSKKAILIDARNDASVVFEDENNDHGVLSCLEAVRAANMHFGIQVFVDEFHAITQYVTRWISENKSGIRDCYLAPRAGQFVFFMVAESESYDFALGEKLAALDIELATKFQLCPCEVIQVPGGEDELPHFVDSSRSRRLEFVPDGLEETERTASGEVASQSEPLNETT